MTHALERRTQVDSIDVSEHALRMGIVYPVRIQSETYRRHAAAAANPDRDVFVMMSAAIDAIDTAIASEDGMPLDMPFHYRHKAKGFRETDIRLFASLHADNEDKPWILLHSTKYAPSVPEASVD